MFDFVNDNYVLLSISAVLGLLFMYGLYLFTNKTQSKSPPSSSPSSSSPSSLKKIPNWNNKPADPILGDLGLLSKHGSLHQYLLYLHDNGRIPITVFWWGKQRVVSVCSPQLFKDTMKLTYRPKLLFELFEPMLTSRSIQYANGTDWEERRKFLYPTLRDEFLKEYIPIFIQIADETASVWSSLSPDNNKIELQEEFFTMTIKGITRTCYGNAFNGEEEVRKMAKVYHIVWNEMEQRLHVGPPEAGSERERIFNESLGLIRDVILSVVKKRKDGTEAEEVPFVDALLQSQVPDEQIISDAVTFMVGGLHTSGYLLVWATYYMSQHPEVLNSVVAEMRNEVGTDRSEKLYEYAYSTTSYLRKVLDESLRLSTLAPYAARYSEENITIGEYSIPAGTPIIDALGVSLKNECLWKNVNKFDPEHFGSCALQGKDAIAFSPFGMGRRKCPGYQFSYVEVTIFLTLLLQRFNLKPVSDKGVGMVHGLVTSPNEPLYYTVHPTASDESTTEE